MNEDVRRFLEGARVGRLATVDARGSPVVVPICYQIGGMRLFTPLDEKPKRVAWDALARVRHLKADPRVAVVVDRWDEDWRRLAWVMLRGTAALAEAGPLQAEGAALLRAKYPQYREMPLEGRPMIVMEIAHVRHWGDLAQGAP